MSTRIYDAYLLPADVNAGNLLEWIKPHRGKIDAIIDQAWARDICKSAVETLDHLVLSSLQMCAPPHDDRLDRTDVVGAERIRLEEAYIDKIKQGARMPGLDTEVKLIVFPSPVGCLAKLICDVEDVKSYFKSMGLSDYSYWDISDEPDGISREEWEARGALWETLLPGGSYEMNGLTINIRKEGDVHYTPISVETVQQHIPQLRKRARQAAHHTPISAEIFKREGNRFSSIIEMDRGEFEEFNEVVDKIEAILPSAEDTANMLLMAPDARAAAISRAALSRSTPLSKNEPSSPRL